MFQGSQPLKKGSDTASGVSPRQRLAEKKIDEKEKKSEILNFLSTHTLAQTAKEYSISELAISKIATPLIRRGDLSANQLIGDIPNRSEIEESLLYSGGSIKKLCLIKGYDEAVVRIIKAEIEGRE